MTRDQTITSRLLNPATRSMRVHPVRLLMTCAAALGLLSAVAVAYGPRTVVAFDSAAKQTPENLAIADDGTIYVSLAFASEIRRIAPDGVQTTLTMPTLGGITVGVAIDRHHGGDLDVAVRSPDAAAAGIWRVPRGRFAHPTRIAALPTEGCRPSGCRAREHRTSRSCSAIQANRADAPTKTGLTNPFRTDQSDSS